MLNRIPRRALLGGLAGACFAAQRLQAVEPAGAVDNSRGECYAQVAATRRALAPAAQVFIGDTVRTGAQSAIGLHLGTATQVRLGAEALLRIDRFVVNAGGILVLERGGMVYDHGPSDAPADVALRTPFGLVAVRPTLLRRSQQWCVRRVRRAWRGDGRGGEHRGGGNEQGSGTDIARPGDEPTQPHLWGAARIAAAMGSVN